MQLLVWQFGCDADISFAANWHAGAAMQSTELRIEPPNTAIINEYRLNDGLLEFRIRDREGRYYPTGGTAWRRLTDSELDTHIALNTVVAQWMATKIWHAS